MIIYRHVRKWEKVYLILLFLVLAIIATVPAFLGGYFKVTYDGGVHLTRWESIYQALKHGKLPVLVNFIGFQGIANAYTGLYPWITSLLFILPRFIFTTNPIAALFCGFVLLNFLTQIATYFMMHEFTAKKLINLMGVFFYQFSAYHMGIMYARNAMGEAIAYAILPVVLTGCLRIWRREKLGWLVLGVGMGALINTHILSVLIVCTLLTITEVVRLFMKKFNIDELYLFCLAIGVAVLTSLYTIVNILVLYLNNKGINTPGHGLFPVGGWDVIQALFANSIEDRPLIFNIGLVETGMLVFLGMMMLIKKRGNWRFWTAITLGIFFCTLSWLPLQKSIFVNSFFGNIQFLGRMLAFVSLFLTISVTVFFEENAVLDNNRIVVPVLLIPLTLMSISAVYSYHITRNDDPTRYYISTAKEYQKLVNKQATGGDYIIKYSQVKGKISDLADIKKVGKYNSLSFDFYNTSKSNKRHNFLVVVYKGLNYHISVNYKGVKGSAPIFRTTLKPGINHIRISMAASLREYLTFTIMLLSNIFAFYILLFRRKGIRICSKKGFFKKLN